MGSSGDRGQDNPSGDAPRTRKEGQEGPARGRGPRDRLCHWVQCSECHTWRIVAKDVVAALNEGPADAPWVCADLFLGSSCSTTSEEIVAHAAELRRQHKLALGFSGAHTASVQGRQQIKRERALRAEARASGLSAAARYSYHRKEGDESDGALPRQGPAQGPRKRYKYGSKRCSEMVAPCDAASSEEPGHAQWGSKGDNEEPPVYVRCTACFAYVDLGSHESALAGRVCGSINNDEESCGAWVRLQNGKSVKQTWVECTACGKWREVSQEEARVASWDPDWACHSLGLSCASTSRDWARVAREEARHMDPCSVHPRLRSPPRRLAQTAVFDGAINPSSQEWQRQPLFPSSLFLGYIPGRDDLLSASQLAAGLDAYDVTDSERQHILWATAVPDCVIQAIEPFVLRGLELYYQGVLKPNTDGRQSAGQLDMAEFLRLPDVKDELAKAVAGRLARLKREAAAANAAKPKECAGVGESRPQGPNSSYAEANSKSPDREDQHESTCIDEECKVSNTDLVPAMQKRGEQGKAPKVLGLEPRATSIRHCLHISQCGRRAFIGEPEQVTRNGTFPFECQKSWRSGPIRSWSGGCKMADIVGHCPNLVTSPLTQSMGAEETFLIQAAQHLWHMFEQHPSTRAAAETMLAAKHGGACLGSTPWNAYSFNIDYRTGKHLDRKNVPGSYSALLILETGTAFMGSFYMLPQYHKALDVRQGTVLFHRSGDPGVGEHGNSDFWRPNPTTHRLAVVLYQTTLKLSGPQPCAAPL
eukprot:jgi/Botrbrau1/89/Bobra.0022s0079.1